MSIYNAVRHIFHSSFSNRFIGRCSSVAESTVRRYRAIIVAQGITWDEVKDLDDTAFYRAFNKPRRGRMARTMPDLFALDAELKAGGFHFQRWYEDYASQNHTTPIAARSTIAARLAQHRDQHDITMRKVYRPGERVEVDYDGDSVRFLDEHSGKWIKAEVFVGVCCASSFMFAYATMTQTSMDFNEAHIRMWEAFGGVPDVVVPDNLKSAVIQINPQVLNANYQAMCDHYGVAVDPARPYRPRDKAMAEAAVKVLQSEIKFYFHRHPAHSLEEINAGLVILVAKINDRLTAGKQPSRRHWFETIERPKLKPLPAHPYDLGEFVKVSKVPKDYHVLIHDNFYSVPHDLVGRAVDVKVMAGRIEIRHGRQLVATHDRCMGKGQTVGALTHMPDNHRSQAEREPDMLKAWAQDAGPNILKFVRDQFDQPRPYLCFKPTETLKDLTHDHGNERVDEAVAEVYRRGRVNITEVRRLLTVRTSTSKRNVIHVRANDAAAERVEVLRAR